MPQTKTSPVISIILCTFNRKRLLSRALRSVFRQTYRSWELIIIDDGSTDGSERLLLPLAQRDGRILYTRHANKGLAQSRNTGLKLARGKYVTFLDSDDEYRRDHLSLHLSHLQSHPKLDAIFGGMKVLGPRAKHHVPDVNKPGKVIHVSKCHAAGTLFAKRKCISALRGFREIAFSEDYDLISRLKRRFNVRRVHHPTYMYHVDAENRLCDLFEKDGVRGILRYRGTE